jgi:hypothetical protein
MMEFLFGAIFMTVGLVTGVILGVVAIQTKQILLALFGLVFILAFCGVGGTTLVMSFKKQHVRKRVLSDGTRVRAKIVNYRYGEGVTVNGVPPIDIVVQCEFHDEMRTFVVPTGKYSESKFPLHSSVEIAILGTDIALVPDSLEL